MTISAVQADIDARVITGLTTATLRSVLHGILLEAAVAQASVATETTRALGVEAGHASRLAALEGSPPSSLPVTLPGTQFVTDADLALDPYWRRLTTSGNRGSFPDLATLRARIPTAREGDWAVISGGAGVDPNVVIWDVDEVPAGWRAAAQDTTALASIIADVVALQGALAAEIARATGAENATASALAQEIADRTAAVAQEVIDRNAAIAAAVAALINGAGPSDDTLSELAAQVASNLLNDTALGGRVTALEGGSTALAGRVSALEAFDTQFAPAGATLGDALVWDGSKFSPAAVSGGSGSSLIFSDGSIY